MKQGFVYVAWEQNAQRNAWSSFKITCQSALYYIYALCLKVNVNAMNDVFTPQQSSLNVPNIASWYFIQSVAPEPLLSQFNQ